MKVKRKKPGIYVVKLPRPRRRAQNLRDNYHALLALGDDSKLVPLGGDSAPGWLVSGVVKSRLFPKARAGSTWEPRFAERLPVDSFVIRCRDLMRSREALEVAGVSNVHLDVRRAIGRAEFVARRDVERRRSAEEGGAASLDSWAVDARAVAGALSDLVDRNWPSLNEVALYVGRRRAYGNVKRDVEQFRDAVGALEVAVDAARLIAQLCETEKSRLIPCRAPGDVWRQAFVACLCDTWRSFFIAKPTPDSVRFRRFVISAYQSLGGNAATLTRGKLPDFTEDSWRGVIGTVMVGQR